MEVIRFSPKKQFLNFLAVRAGLAACGPYDNIEDIDVMGRWVGNKLLQPPTIVNKREGRQSVQPS